MKQDKRRRTLWDAKRGRYIKTSMQELRKSRALSKRMKMGGPIKKYEFGKHYARWAKKAKKAVGSVGESESVR